VTNGYIRTAYAVYRWFVSGTAVTDGFGLCASATRPAESEYRVQDAFLHDTYDDSAFATMGCMNSARLDLTAILVEP